MCGIRVRPGKESLWQRIFGDKDAFEYMLSEAFSQPMWS